mmetsp:Transcript_39461/g.64670  ORF Transcript_39461/g.64670 Transcript_39461/m.64670 type:complete len:238 (+) Transcript_39461:321-1034(+)
MDQNRHFVQNFEVVLFLKARDVQSFSETCKHADEVCSSNGIWRELILRDFPTSNFAMTGLKNAFSKKDRYSCKRSYFSIVRERMQTTEKERKSHIVRLKAELYLLDQGFFALLLLCIQTAGALTAIQASGFFDYPVWVVMVPTLVFLVTFLCRDVSFVMGHHDQRRRNPAFFHLRDIIEVILDCFKFTAELLYLEVCFVVIAWMWVVIVLSVVVAIRMLNGEEALSSGLTSTYNQLA